MPDNMSRWGDLIAPEQSTTLSASMLKTSPPLSASTPTAFRSLMMIFLTATPPLMVRLRRWRTGPRKVMAALIRMPSRLFDGDTPTPAGLAPLVSSVGLYPSLIKASRNARWMSGVGPD